MFIAAVHCPDEKKNAAQLRGVSWKVSVVKRRYI
jgi:hypothetical protein